MYTTWRINSVNFVFGCAYPNPKTWKKGDVLYVILTIGWVKTSSADILESILLWLLCELICCLVLACWVAFDEMLGSDTDSGEMSITRSHSSKSLSDVAAVVWWRLEAGSFRLLSNSRLHGLVVSGKHGCCTGRFGSWVWCCIAPRFWCSVGGRDDVVRGGWQAGVVFQECCWAWDGMLTGFCRGIEVSSDVIDTADESEDDMGLLAALPSQELCELLLGDVLVEGGLPRFSFLPRLRDLLFWNQTFKRKEYVVSRLPI